MQNNVPRTHHQTNQTLQNISKEPLQAWAPIRPPDHLMKITTLALGQVASTPVPFDPRMEDGGG